tara:strand:+ start:3471 stop:3845 length:375 start_codon:yes stop_codon:yes gene_type:complete
MKIEVSNGEIVDKLTILLIKKENIKDKEKLKNIQNEINQIEHISNSIVTKDSEEFIELYEVNKSLWEIEDNIRRLELRKQFDEEFISVARSVYRNNDKRAEIKRQINQMSGSELVEEKSYKEYT